MAKSVQSELLLKKGGIPATSQERGAAFPVVSSQFQVGRKHFKNSKIQRKLQIIPEGKLSEILKESS